jgi:hypothetical protein
MIGLLYHMVTIDDHWNDRIMNGLTMGWTQGYGKEERRMVVTTGQ